MAGSIAGISASGRVSLLVVIGAFWTPLSEVYGRPEVSKPAELCCAALMVI